jgi:post-segregation antitoxin (ccd killing protein)
VIRTQIQLTEDQTRELKRWAEQRRVSMAAVIREAIDEHLRRRSGPPWQEVVARAIAAAGSAHSGSGDVSRRHDEYFAESAEASGEAYDARGEAASPLSRADERDVP